MRTSKNPISGEIECYTDIGQFIGILPRGYGMVLPVRKKTADADRPDTGWRTTENGKHYKINGEGEIVAGPSAMVGGNVNSHSESSSLEDLFGDIWGAIEQHEEERKAQGPEEEKRKAEEQERAAFGQNGKLESEYPEDLRLTNKEREYMASNVEGFFDRAHSKKTDHALTGEMYKAAKGDRLLVNLDFERRRANEKLSEAEEMIAQRVQEGYKGMSREESFQRWQQLKEAMREADETEVGEILSSFAVGKEGIRAWQSQRKEAKKTLAACDFIEKLQKRAAFAKGVT